MRCVNVIAITVLWFVSVQSLEAATVSWDKNPEPTVVGYKLSYGTQPGSHPTTVDVGNVVTHVLSPPVGQRYYIVVQAYDATGLSPKSTEVVLDLTTTNLAPTLNQPPNQSGAVGSSVTLALVATDPEEAALTYSASGLPPGLTINSSTGVISGTLQTAGNYSVTATVSDGSLTSSKPFTWIASASTTSAPLPSSTTPTADATAPTVAFTSPVNNETLNGKKVNVRITASDAGGLKSVSYLLNGNTLSGAISVAPYNYSWDTGSVANGTYQLTARAIDNAGNVGSATITVTVKTGGNGKNSLTSDSATSATADAPAAGEGEDGRAALTRPDVSVSGDFDGDGLSDPGTFNAATGEWRLWLSSIRYGAAAPMIWGMPDDVPVPADYDGDGRTDLAVFRPSTGTWSIVASNKGTPSRLEIAWGRLDDTPVPFDYDHDGRADLALRGSAGLDILLSSSNYTTSVTVR